MKEGLKAKGSLLPLDEDSYQLAAAAALKAMASSSGRQGALAGSESRRLFGDGSLTLATSNAARRRDSSKKLRGGGRRTRVFLEKPRFIEASS